MKEERSFLRGDFVKAVSLLRHEIILAGIVLKVSEGFVNVLIDKRASIDVPCDLIRRLDPVLDKNIIEELQANLGNEFKKMAHVTALEEAMNKNKILVEKAKKSVENENCFSDGRDLEKEYEQQVKEEIAENANCKPDMVNHPPHYCQKDGLECIDVMQLMFGKQAVIDYCRCNIFKYRFRAEHKNGDEDIKKAQWYENKLNELLGAGFTIKGKA